VWLLPLCPCYQKNSYTDSNVYAYDCIRVPVDEEPLNEEPLNEEPFNEEPFNEEL
jgi:hypothetical protein